MSAPGAAKQRSAAVRLAGIGLLAAGVTVALYVADRLHTPNFTFSLFGRVGLDAIAFKSLLATIALGLAVLQVLLAMWIYRKLPLAGSPPRRVRLAHRVIGFGSVRADRADRRALRARLRRAAHQSQGGGALDRGLFLLRCLCREGTAGTEQAAAGLGAAGCRGHARRRRRRAVVHLGAVVLQRLPATRRCRRGRAAHVRPAREAPARAVRTRASAPGWPARVQGTLYRAIPRPLSRTCMCSTD